MTEPAITSGGREERVRSAAKLLSEEFVDDPVIRYMLDSMSSEKRAAYFLRYFEILLSAAALNSARFDEADGWSSCAVWMPPGRRVDNPATLLPAGLISILWNIGIQGCRRMLLEFGPQSDDAKAKGLKNGEKYYYLFFIATKKEKRGKGLSTALIKRYQAIATEKGTPIWLEATTSYSRDIYKKIGFEIVSEMVLGKGKAAPDGTSMVGGEGVKVWAMLWRPSS